MREGAFRAPNIYETIQYIENAKLEIEWNSDNSSSYAKFHLLIYDDPDRKLSTKNIFL